MQECFLYPKAFLKRQADTHNNRNHLIINRMYPLYQKHPLIEIKREMLFCILQISYICNGIVQGICCFSVIL